MKQKRISDRFLILLFALCLLAVGFRAYRVRSSRSGDGAVYEMLLVWERVDVRTAACLSEGELLYTASGEAFGRVVRIEAYPSISAYTLGGVRYEGELPREEIQDLHLTVAVEGMRRNGRVLQRGQELPAVGERKRLYSAYCEINALVRFGAADASQNAPIV